MPPLVPESPSALPPCPWARPAGRVTGSILIMILTLTSCASGQRESAQIGNEHGDTGLTSAQIDVLFVGNSYTYFNDLPMMVEEIAAANGWTVESTMIAPGGYFLEDHVADGDAVDALASGIYEIVVVQEQSVAPALASELHAITIPAAHLLDDAADNVGTRVILYQTWGREGLGDLGLRNYSQMQQALIDGYDTIADQTGADVARVGESWQQVLGSGSGLNLYADDGSHPSPEGSYLAALAIAEALLGIPVSVAPAVTGVDAVTADLILTSSN